MVAVGAGLAILLVLAAWAHAAPRTCWTGEVVEVGAVVDGDTVAFKLRITSPTARVSDTLEVQTVLLAVRRVRLLLADGEGVDTPELRGPEAAAALKARAFTRAWLAKGNVTVWSCRDDAFGRSLGVVERDDGANLGADLLAAGLAVRWRKEKQ